jgi:hypothetical protein
VSSEDEEARLRAALAEAHRRDVEVTPAFARVWGPRRSTAARPVTRWVVLSAGVLAVVVALVVWRTRVPHEVGSSLPAGTRWIGPTDFLLQTPDLVTLHTVPALDLASDPYLHPPTDGRDLR